jgi:hypothetical protein
VIASNADLPEAGAATGGVTVLTGGGDVNSAPLGAARLCLLH